jgi:hypothetical protein
MRRKQNIMPCPVGVECSRTAQDKRAELNCEIAALLCSMDRRKPATLLNVYKKQSYQQRYKYVFMSPDEFQFFQNGSEQR